MAARNKMALVLLVAIQAVLVVCRHSTESESNSNDVTEEKVQKKAKQDGQRIKIPQWQYDGIPIDVGARVGEIPKPHERAPGEGRIRAQAEMSRARAEAENAKIRAHAEKSRLQSQAESMKIHAQAEKSRLRDHAESMKIHALAEKSRLRGQVEYAEVRPQAKKADLVARPEESKARLFGEARRHMTPLWQYDGVANEKARRRAHRPRSHHHDSAPSKRSHTRHKTHKAQAPESSDESWSPKATAPTTTTTTTPPTTRTTTTTTTTPEPVFPPLDRRYRRIYNADETAKIEEYPFIAAILVNNELWCGGAVINGDSVLTAAHCLQLQYNNRFFREYVKMLSVRVGSSNATVGGEHFRVTELFFHPNYKPQSLEFNFALLKLNKNITFSSKVQPITVARNKVIPIDKTVTFLGWGSVLGVGETGGQVLLQKLDLPVYDLSDCQEIYGRDLVSRSNFCAGYISTRKNVCNHDAGGPAIMDGVLTGVLSFSSKRCDDTDKPAVFSNTGHAADWLDGISEGRSRTQKTSAPGFGELESKKYIN